MDEATFQILGTLCNNENVIEYWIMEDSAWAKSRPCKNQRRCHDVVHESGLARVGDEEQGGSLDASYRLHGCENLVSVSATALLTRNLAHKHSL